MRGWKKLSGEYEGRISKLDTPKAGITVYILRLFWMSCPNIQWVDRAPSSPMGTHGGVAHLWTQLLSDHWLDERGQWGQRVTLQHTATHALSSTFSPSLQKASWLLSTASSLGKSSKVPRLRNSHCSSVYTPPSLFLETSRISPKRIV